MRVVGWVVLAGLVLAGCGKAPSAPVVAAAKGSDPQVVARGATGEGNPVLLIHGIYGSEQNFAVMQPWLRQNGFDPVALNFVDVAWKDWSLDDLADQVGLHVMALRQRTGKDQIDIVAHSLGGVAARQYIKFHGGDKYIKHLVCLGSPHHGVGYAVLGPGITIATLFRPHSQQLNALNRPTETYGAVSYTNVWSTGDYMEILPFASGRQIGAFNYRIDGTTHGGMTTDPRIFPTVKESLLRPLAEVPGPERHLE
jgi:pimeloyl-ACP methyl ester carboxylesterase